MRTLLPDLLILVGAALVPLGVALIHWPAAIAVLGVECLGFGFIAARGGSR